jgi:hypothetical protein
MDLVIQFLNKFGFQYVPENAEDETEYFTFTDFQHECEEAFADNPELREKFADSNALLSHMIDNIEWEFPSTFIEDQINFD